MKKLISVMVLFVFLTLTSMAMASFSVTLSQGPYSYYPGGEFTAVTSTYGTFQTFCLEKDEYFNPGSTYSAVLNTEALAGGVNTNDGDPISIGTARLFWEFTNGTLPGYFSAASRQQEAGKLQLAIWWLEAETAVDPNNTYSNYIKGLYANPKADNAGAFSVYAMNLTDLAGGLHQDMLIATPIPAALWLLGSGLLGLVGLRRKFKG